MKCKFIILFCFAVSSGVYAFSFPEESDSYRGLVIEQIINSQFNEALLICDSLIRQNPSDPLPSVLKLAVIGMRDVDFEKVLDSTGFISSYNKSLDLVTEYQKQAGISSYSKTLEGLCKAIHATFYLRTKAYVPSLQNGFNALKLLQEAKDLDSSNAEADFFLGLYDYARAELRSKLWWILFWYPGNRENGIRKLENCSRSAELTGTAAKLSLCDIYTEEKKPERSLHLIKELEKRYPQSRFVLWSKAKYYEAIQDYSLAAAAYEKLSDSYALVPEGEYNSAVTRNKLAHMLVMNGEKEKASRICEKLLCDKTVINDKTMRKDTERLLERIKNGGS